MELMVDFLVNLEYTPGKLDLETRIMMVTTLFTAIST
jgi:hypothetical protein